MAYCLHCVSVGNSRQAGLKATEPENGFKSLRYVPLAHGLECYRPLEAVLDVHARLEAYKQGFPMERFIQA